MSGGTLSFRETPKYNAVTDEKRPKNNKVCYVLYNFNKDWKPSIWESEMLYGQDHDRLGGGGGSLKASCELKERLHTGMQQVNN